MLLGLEVHPKHYSRILSFVGFASESEPSQVSIIQSANVEGSFPAPPLAKEVGDDVACCLLRRGGEFRQCVLLVAPSQIAKSDKPRQGVCPGKPRGFVLGDGDSEFAQAEAPRLAEPSG